MSLGRRNVQCQRPSGAYVDGLWVESGVSEFTIWASVQPVTPKEMESLEEGRRSRDMFKLYSDTALRTVGEQNPDRVVINGKLYEVVGRGDHQSGIISHYKMFVGLCDHTPGGAA